MVLGFLYFNLKIIFNPWPTLFAYSMGDRIIFKGFLEVIKNLVIRANYPHGFPPIYKKPLKPSEMPFLAINSSMISMPKTPHFGTYPIGVGFLSFC
jgi:hypothetical protein